VSKKRLTPEESKRPPGRPRCERARHAILSSTVKFLQTKGNGFADLAIEHVAAEAGVGKATVYRWWPNKAALVADAFMASVDPKLQFPDTGSVVGDMSRQMQQLVRILRSRRGQVLSVIMGAGQSDAMLMRAFRERFLKPRRAGAYETLRRGMMRGELPADLDMDLTLDALYGAIYHRFLIGHDTLTPEFIEGLCEMVLHGAASTHARRDGHRRLVAEAGAQNPQPSRKRTANSR
jgi:AcrR family transcriptional regulator